MLTFARLYTANVKKFIATKNYTEPNSVDVCLAVLVLQHTENPKKEIENLYNVLKPNGYLVLVNENKRFVPSDVDAQRYVIWKDDGFDIFTELKNKFDVVDSVQYMNTETSIMFYKKPG
jgi:SAM-dependent methyltransferase